MHNDDTNQPPTAVLFEAIARHIAVRATYNRQEMLLAPHIVYTRHGDLFIDAVALEREGKPPREFKLGTFKLAGLSGLSLSRRAFAPSELYDPSAERYEGTAIFAIEREPAPVI